MSAWGLFNYRYVGGICVGIEITTHERIEKSLCESENRYRELVQNANSAIIRDIEKKAEETLSSHRKELDTLAHELHDRETLSKDEIEALLDLPSEPKDSND
jgi:ATP-dependent Zn protease